jgi:hypothetical protein
MKLSLRPSVAWKLATVVSRAVLNGEEGASERTSSLLNVDIVV